MGKTLGVACALFFCVIILALMHKTYVPDSGFAEMETEKLVAFGTTKEMGKILFTKYLLPFEAASVLLLGAIVGALVLARRPGNGDER